MNRTETVASLRSALRLVRFKSSDRFEPRSQRSRILSGDGGIVNHGQTVASLRSALRLPWLKSLRRHQSLLA